MTAKPQNIKYQISNVKGKREKGKGNELKANRQPANRLKAIFRPSAVQWWSREATVRQDRPKRESRNIATHAFFGVGRSQKKKNQIIAIHYNIE